MRTFQNALLGALVVGLSWLGGCGGDADGGPTPAVKVSPEEIVPHYCPPNLPKADLRRIGTVNNQTAFKVWCYGADSYNPETSSRALEDASPDVNYAKYYLCVDKNGSPSGSYSAQLRMDEHGYYVDCQ